MRYVGFGEKQRLYLKRSLGAWLNVAEGGKRAGKNVLNVLAFAMALERSVERLHLVAGVTKGCARLNILDCNGFGLKGFFGARGREGKYEGKDAFFVRCGDGEKVVIIEGGGRASDAARIKGASFGSVYISEANEVHSEFFFEALDRTLASRDRRVFLDLNAKGEGHWFYREFLGMFVTDPKGTVMEDCGVNYGHFTVFDNLALSGAELEKALGSYDKGSVWYKRDILGLRGAGAESIYVGFGRGNVLGKAEMAGKRFVRMSVGVDVGGRDATVATLVGITEAGEMCFVDGYYHRQGDGEYMTHDRYVFEIGERIEGWVREYAALEFGGAVFCESAEKMFRTALGLEIRRRGLNLGVYSAYKRDGVLDRIRFFCLLIGRGRFFVAEHMGEWVDAFYAARWCEKARGRGEWVRVDDGSYGVDCLDSGEYGGIVFKGVLVGAASGR